MVLPGFPGRLNADIGTKKLKRATEHFQQGNSLYSKKRIDQAIAEYHKALQGDSEEPYWHQALAKALEDAGDSQGALEEYRIAALQSPLDAGLRSKYEELASKLHVNVEPKPAKTTPTSGGAFAVGGQVTAPIPTYKPEPPYTEKARKAKYKGSTVLSIVVDAEGNVEDTRVVKPLGVGLDEIALETIQTWKFKPATRGGVPVAVRAMVEVSFKLF